MLLRLSLPQWKEVESEPSKAIYALLFLELMQILGIWLVVNSYKMFSLLSYYAASMLQLCVDLYSSKATGMRVIREAAGGRTQGNPNLFVKLYYN